RRFMNSGQSGKVGRDQTEWRPWLYHFLMGPTIVGCCFVFGVAVVYRLDGLCNTSDCIDRVPYRRALIVLAALAFLVKWLERLWHKLRPPTHLRRAHPRRWGTGVAAGRREAIAGQMANGRAIRNKPAPWINDFLWVPAIIGLFVVGCLAVVY